MGISKNITYDGLNRTGGDDYATRINFATLGNSKAVKQAPVTAIKTAAYTVGEADRYIIMNGSGALALTLPTAADWPGREIYVKTIAAFAVTAVGSVVKPADSNTAGTAILAGTAGKFALLVSDGAHWVIMASN